MAGDGRAPVCAHPCLMEDAPPPGVDRRTFVLAAAALALTACAGGDDGLGSGTAPTTVGTSLDVTTYSALSANGGIALVTLQNTPLAIVRVSDTNYLALSRVCPHQGATVGVNGTGFRCPRHGATFDVTGKWVSGERTTSMKSYLTTYNAVTHQLTIG
jgi:nitrite reductase/ring-hydroxylating ferredoxin subunit